MSLTDESHAHLLAHHRDFAAFAQTMVETHAGRFDDVFWGFFARYAPADAKQIVDLGTGPGLLLPALAARCPGARVVGVEAQPEMLRRAREALAAEKDQERLELVELDLAVGRLPFADATVDVVIASVLLHELPVPTPLLDEVRRVLRPGGVLLIYDWVRQPLSTYFDGDRPESHDEWTHFSEHCRLTADDVAWLVDKSGLVVREWIGRKNGRFVLLAAERQTT